MFRHFCFFLAFLLVQSVLTAQQDCAFLRVSLATDGWVACDNAVCRIRLCNEGGQAANNARVEIPLPATLGFVSSSLPSFLFNNRVIFNLGTLAAGDCLDFSMTLAVDCGVEPGEAICLVAKATPRLCPSAAPGWDGSDLQVYARCYAPDSIAFVVQNQGAGAMSVATSYIITEDHLMREIGPIPEIDPSGVDSLVIPVHLPTGKTYTFQTMQTPGHPFPQPISVSIEGCGGPPQSRGYLLQYPQHSGDVHSDTYCDAVSAGIMGADKTGFPLGYGAEHWIDRATVLDYRIRFQNTGATTVQTVTLVDTLSDWLDLSTFRAGAASHLYTFSIQNHVLTVVFPAAQLPPAAVNEPASRGFFTFHIGVLPGTPAGTVLENTALVRLDAQPYVPSDTTRHRVGANFITTRVLEPNNNGRLSVQLSPNPMSTSARFVFSGTEAQESILVQLFDPAGRLVRSLETRAGALVLEREQLAAGFYLFRCQSRSGAVLAGKIVVGQ
ncbi:MAG: hypothetical protein IT260_21245 [Saprospiraceae bacterium]|nr:hypothetical protein [Saprospiraceae bacterium]